MNLITRFAVSLVITIAIGVAGYFVRRRVAQLAHEAGIAWPTDDVGMEVSPGLMNAIAITDLLYHIRFSLLGAIFCLNFLAIGWFYDQTT